MKVAAKTSALAGLRVAGKSAAIYTLTMQLSRGKVVNPFYSILKNNSVKNTAQIMLPKVRIKLRKKSVQVVLQNPSWVKPLNLIR